MSDGLPNDAVARAAWLARLTLGADEQALYARQLAQILDYVAQVQAVDTTGVPPMAQPAACATEGRDDTVTPSLDRDAVLAEAPDPDREAGFFKVPRVLGS